MAMLSGGRIPPVVDRAIVSTGPGDPLGDGMRLSLAVSDDIGDPDGAELASALDEGATELAGEPVAHPARTSATSPVSSLAFVTRRS
jgi:hypothetical protein